MSCFNSFPTQNTCANPHCGCCTCRKNAYCAETYVGNWYEETVGNTLKREEFLRKRECEDLSIQRSQIMVDILLKPVELTVRSTGDMHYGDSVQLISPGPDCRTALEKSPFRKLCNMAYLALSASVPSNVIDEKPFLDTDSVITLSPHLYPVVRNSFVLEHPKCPDDRSRINYGDCFRIRAMPTQQWPLYLHCAPSIKFHSAAVHSGKPLVRFSDTKNPNTLWCVQPLDPRDRIRIPLGIAVPLKQRVMIQHAISGLNLSLEDEYPALTYFGCEYEVSVETKRDTVRRISFQNHWAFDTERGWPNVEYTDKKFMENAKFAAAINADDVNKSASDVARKEEKERREKEGPEMEEMSPKEMYEQQKEQVRQQAAWNTMFTKAIEGNSPRQKKETNKYPELPADPPPVYLSEIPPPERNPFLVTESPAEIENRKRQLEEDFPKKSYLETAVPGHIMAHDPSTSPQPMAHQYRLSEHQEFYPNKKWNCKDSFCCHPRSALPSCVPECIPGQNCAEPQ